MSAPDWSKHAPKLPEGPCAIEMYAFSLGIERGEWAKSAEIKAWIRRYCRTRYVPSEVLKELNILVD